MLSHIAQVDPLPLVPATWITGSVSNLSKDRSHLQTNMAIVEVARGVRLMSCIVSKWRIAKFEMLSSNH